MAPLVKTMLVSHGMALHIIGLTWDFIMQNWFTMGCHNTMFTMTYKIGLLYKIGLSWDVIRQNEFTISFVTLNWFVMGCHYANWFNMDVITQCWFIMGCHNTKLVYHGNVTTQNWFTMNVIIQNLSPWDVIQIVLTWISLYYIGLPRDGNTKNWFTMGCHYTKLVYHRFRYTKLVYHECHYTKFTTMGYQYTNCFEMDVIILYWFTMGMGFHYTKLVYCRFH